MYISYRNYPISGQRNCRPKFHVGASDVLKTLHAAPSRLSRVSGYFVWLFMWAAACCLTWDRNKLYKLMGSGLLLLRTGFVAVSVEEVAVRARPRVRLRTNLFSGSSILLKQLINYIYKANLHPLAVRIVAVFVVGLKVHNPCSYKTANADRAFEQ